MLEVKGLKKAFVKKGQEVVAGVDFIVGGNEVVGIVGKSGCGKSTLARLIVGAIRQDSGDVLFEGKSVFSSAGKYLPEMRRNIQMIGQHPFMSLDPRQRVGEAVMEPMIRNRICTKKEAKKRARLLLKSVWLTEEVFAKYPHQLSGGMCQRVAVARALGLSPKLLIADECTSMLDTSAQAQVIRLFQKLREEQQLSMIFISHDLNLVKVFSDRVLYMKNGTLHEEETV